MNRNLVALSTGLAGAVENQLVGKRAAEGWRQGGLGACSNLPATAQSSNHSELWSTSGIESRLRTAFTDKESGRTEETLGLYEIVGEKQGAPRDKQKFRRICP
jgi:hypothetical protein